jgi:hypothetical protein
MPILSGVSGNALAGSPNLVDAEVQPLGAAPLHEPLVSLTVDPVNPLEPEA